MGLLAAGCSHQPAGHHGATAEGSARAANGTKAAAVEGRAPTALPYNPRGVDFAQAPEKIAFAGGANQNEAQPLWKTVLAASPDLFLFVGDLVDATDTNSISDQYKKLDALADYRNAREKIPFMAIWNDRDLGTLDGGADAATKAQARRDFLNHWVYVKDSIPFNRDGLYHAKLMGGQVSGKRRKRVSGPTMQVIMLDTRSFRSPLKKASEGPRRFAVNDDKSATLLGNDQWEWLEDQLQKPAQLRVIVTPIQLVATEPNAENWGLFPHEREKFFQLLKKTKAKNVLVLSGDRRLASIAKTDVKGWGPLYDVTAGPINEADAELENDSTYVSPVYIKENFGLLDIDWKRKRVGIEIKDIEGKTVQSVSIKLN
ncbi:MAG: alkaline phosphatase family protein [Bdellovibrionaceae bacterium]|nr:alkaline phosphatase family protein [Pseudobdellovibrionaceae bacterium]